VRFEVLTVASMKMAVFWVAAPCNLVGGYFYGQWTEILIPWHEKCPIIPTVYIRHSDVVLYTPKIQQITTRNNKP
jgi:hypothetical protein